MSILPKTDWLTKTSHSAGFLVSDLRELYPLTKTIAEEMVVEQLLVEACKLQQRIDRLAAEAQKGTR